MSIKSHTCKNALVLNHVTKQVYQMSKGNSRVAKVERDSEAQLAV